MRTFLVGAIAALGLSLGTLPGKASAYWAVRTAYRYDPVVAAMVPVSERYWVPDVVVAPAPTPVYYDPPPYRVYPRLYYYGPAVNFYCRYRR
jgi:hypothetical protein